MKSEWRCIKARTSQPRKRVRAPAKLFDANGAALGNARHGVPAVRYKGATMKKRHLGAIAVLSLVFVGVSSSVRAEDDVTTTLVRLANTYALNANITYRTVSHMEAKLDVMQPRGL